ncbi:hypothetical protein HK101_003986, partial [Irineochytrium annulatum]
MGASLSREEGQLPFAWADPSPSIAAESLRGSGDHNSHHEVDQTEPAAEDPPAQLERARSHRRLLNLFQHHRPDQVQIEETSHDFDTVSIGTLDLEDGDILELESNASPKNSRLRSITFGQLTSLTTIGLCSQELVRMSPNMGLLFMTTTLELCCNKLVSIPPEIGYMRSLRILSVAKNRLTSLPETIGYLTRLEELRVSENSLVELPPSIGELSKLSQLFLDDNKLEVVPVEIGQNKNLMMLDLSNNPLRTLPAEVNRLKYLRKLKLENCPLVDEFIVESKGSPPTLKELAARVIVRHQVPILEVTPEDIKEYLASAHACSFCGGPYFNSFVIRGKVVEKFDAKIPFQYQLCMTHWNSEQGY